ncbi:hypothetical protein AXK58_16510 [Tsukamurella tyrosinosolvens]|nr:hypothetical protein AXK58_16510 [Tsukamurella tyrosinosolvens]
MAGWGTIGPFSLRADATPIAIAAWRCVFAVVALGALCWATKAFTTSTYSRASVALTLIGGAALVANWVFLFHAFQSTTLTVATVAYHTEPFFLVALGAAASRRLPRRTDLGWLAVALVGLLLATQFVSAHGLALNGSNGAGVAAALLAGALYALATFLARETTGLHPQVMTLIQCALGAAVLLPIAGNLNWSSSSWTWIAAMGGIHTGLLYWILYATVRALSVVVVAALSFVNPAVAVLTDIAIYHHIPTVGQLVGIAFIVVATLATTLRAGPSRAGAVHHRDSPAAS